MQRFLQSWTPESALAGAGAGVVAGIAYLVAQALDLRLLRNRADDLAIHGRPFSADPARWRPLGGVLHLAFGAALGAIYAGWPRRRLTAALPAWVPPWGAGVLFLQVENTALYPALAVLHRVHPAWRSGTLESYYRPLTYAQQVWRHVVFGAVLGALLGRPNGES